MQVCQFIDGVKVDQNPDGEEQVDPSFIHKSFASGSTLQALHPQQYTPAVWKINAALEVRANLKLYPAKGESHCISVQRFQVSNSKPSVA
jgi:hypothetical protein